jgi:hypothetical protein
MAKFEVTYTIPVVVTVDTDTNSVTQVLEYCDELGSCWPDVRDENGDGVTPEQHEQALAIADGTDWPVWDRA